MNNISKDQILNEYIFTGIGPKNLEEISVIDGVSIYSNDEIKKSFEKMILNLNPDYITVKGPFLKAIREEKIVIGYTKKFPLFLLNRIKKWTIHKMNRETSSILGWYSKKYKKIGLILDDNIDLYGKLKVDIAEILLHEYIHMAAAENNNIFFSLFKNDLIKFYKNFLRNVIVQTNSGNFNEITDQKIEKFVKSLLEKETEENVFISDFINSYDELLKDTELYKNKSFLISIILSPYFKYMFNEVDDTEQFIPLVQKCIYSAYISIGLKSFRTVPCQESLIPSEIICIKYENKPNNNISKLLK